MPKNPPQPQEESIRIKAVWKTGTFSYHDIKTTATVNDLKQTIAMSFDPKFNKSWAPPDYQIMLSNGDTLDNPEQVIDKLDLTITDKKAEIYIHADPKTKKAAPPVRNQISLVIVTPQQEKIKVACNPQDKISVLRDKIASEISKNPKLTSLGTGKLKASSIKYGSRWGEHSQHDWSLRVDGGALQDEKPISYYNFHESATIYMHGKLRIWVDPTGMYLQEYEADYKECSENVPSNQYKEIYVFHTDTIGVVRRECSRVTGFQPHVFHLAHGGDLVESHTVMGSGIKNGSTVHMHRVRTKEFADASARGKSTKVVPMKTDAYKEIKLFFRTSGFTQDFSVMVKKGESVK